MSERGDAMPKCPRPRAARSGAASGLEGPRSRAGCKAAEHDRPRRERFLREQPCRRPLSGAIRGPLCRQLQVGRWFGGALRDARSTLQQADEVDDVDVGTGLLDVRQHLTAVLVSRQHIGLAHAANAVDHLQH